MTVVIDTNVAVVAEGLHQRATESCIATCIDKLSEVMERGGLVLDDDDEIVIEYVRTLGHAGQPGVGRAFVKWAWDYRFDDDRITRSTIRRRNIDDWRGYEEFPHIDALSTFDRDDQKFVAVALVTHPRPDILNAVDSDWWEHRHSLANAGVYVEFLCPQQMPPA